MSILILKFENLRLISPSEASWNFLDKKGVSAPQKLGDFVKKMLLKNNDFSSKNTQNVQTYWKFKNDVKTALRPLFKELWANYEKSDFNHDFELIKKCDISRRKLKKRGDSSKPSKPISYSYFELFTDKLLSLD